MSQREKETHVKSPLYTWDLSWKWFGQGQHFPKCVPRTWCSWKKNQWSKQFGNYCILCPAHTLPGTPVICIKVLHTCYILWEQMLNTSNQEVLRLIWHMPIPHSSPRSIFSMFVEAVSWFLEGNVSLVPLQEGQEHLFPVYSYLSAQRRLFIPS